MDECPDNIIGRDLIDIFYATDIYWHTFVIRKCYSRLIHDSDIFLEDFMEMKSIISDSICMFFWVFIIDAIDFRRFDDDITLELEGAEYRT